jgi:hypothetical protein
MTAEICFIVVVPVMDYGDTSMKVLQLISMISAVPPSLTPRLS